MTLEVSGSAASVKSSHSLAPSDRFFGSSSIRQMTLRSPLPHRGRDSRRYHGPRHPQPEQVVPGPPEHSRRKQLYSSPGSMPFRLRRSATSPIMRPHHLCFLRSLSGQRKEERPQPSSCLETGAQGLSNV